MLSKTAKSRQAEDGSGFNYGRLPGLPERCVEARIGIGWTTVMTSRSA